MTPRFDIAVVGAGMAGASVAAELAPHRRVVVLEAEDRAGRHATGRSAAMFFESYGNPTVQALTRASRAFHAAPPTGFGDAPLLRPRAALFVADAAQAPRLAAMVAASPTLHAIDRDAALARCPILRRDWLAAAALDTTGADLDVAAIHDGFLRIARRHGAELRLDAGVRAIGKRPDGAWRIDCRDGTAVEAGTVVDAAGAWADEVARLAGVAPVGLQPMRRTAMTVPAPDGLDGVADWPLVIDADETFYFKPDAGLLLLSPANEDPSPPCDAAPDELDIAHAVDRFERATTHPVRRIAHRWAGLRSFVADRSPVCGFDAQDRGFFWLAGQGGYGIQMAPALARTAAALLLHGAVPDDVAALGVRAIDLSPARPALSASASAGAPSAPPR